MTVISESLLLLVLLKYLYNLFAIKKTKGLQYLDLSEQSRAYLGEAGSPDERAFTGLKYSSYMNVELSKWMMRAGITKDITFHCARHTFAVLQLSLGTEIFTLSKLLGHSNLKTTQIYAKIIDEKKRDEFLTNNKLRILRDYQLKAVKAVQSGIADGKDRFLLEMATGTGKTLTSSAIIKMFLRLYKVKRVLFLVDRLELESQAQKWLRDLCHQNTAGMPAGSHPLDI